MSGLLWSGPQGPRRRAAQTLAAALCATLLALPLSLLAQGVAAETDYQGIALRWARNAAQAEAPVAQSPLRLEVSVGNMDTRLRLAPCASVEAYLPPGSRLWGHSRVGLRCLDGPSRWNVSLPVTVKAMGLAWVVRGQVSAGAVLVPSDAVQVEVDWAEESSPVLQESAAWVGQLAAHSLTTGQTLRVGMVKAAQVFQPGAQLRVVAEGAGFSASADAEALSAGVIGQQARVRMDNGRITTGTVLDAHTVKIEI